ncbi:MAG TPA: YbaB/EbfC family nucleoid-associated protein [Acidimicrobiales bacterium]|nr:YbaB/EbfC family nucleoid-associated protein [Acidimicrobiales bacterium]
MSGASGQDGGIPDFGSLLSQLGQVQENLRQAQEEAAHTVVEGSAGGGAVRVTATGGLEFQSVRIDSSVLDPADVDMLEDLVLAAVRDAVEKAQALTSEAIGGIAGNLGGLLGGGGGGPADPSGLLGL